MCKGCACALRGAVARVPTIEVNPICALPTHLFGALPGWHCVRHEQKAWRQAHNPHTAGLHGGPQSGDDGVSRG
eukprot:3532516-Heterocapsa_arctica.AAC.1